MDERPVSVNFLHTTRIVVLQAEFLIFTSSGDQNAERNIDLISKHLHRSSCVVQNVVVLALKHVLMLNKVLIEFRYVVTDR